MSPSLRSLIYANLVIDESTASIYAITLARHTNYHDGTLYPSDIEAIDKAFKKAAQLLWESK